RTLFIESVENPTTETWLGPLVRSMFRDELTRRGWTNWDSRGNADGLVQITIDKFSRTSTVTDENADTLKFVSSISLSAQITDRDSGEVLWNSGSVSWGGTYYGTNSSPETTADTFATDHAIRRLADLLSQGY
ncbi:MAG: DUF4136 domain-containing protein, partial [Proteobacteria bacterium]|nr:DUF4136 domain-containing protein [Pseudomonadota bacterium]